ncbi:c-type cytochrome [Halomonas shantousis]
MKPSKLIVGCLAALGLSLGSAQAADMSKEAIAERLAPVGELCLQGDDCGGAPAVAAVSDTGGARSGEDVYSSVCSVCHASGVAGAPVRGSEADWSARLEKGMETLYSHAINGFNAMPPKGGNPSLSDQEVKNGVNYLTEPVRGDDVAIDTGDAAAEAGATEENAGGEATADAGADSGNASAVGATQVAAVGDTGNGEEVYNSICMACHSTGAAGAPKRGDDTAWEPRLAKGVDTLYDHAVNGFNAMPPKGGNPALSDEDVHNAVDYIISALQ